MNDALTRLAADMQLSDPRNDMLRLHFGFACAGRVAHLLEDLEAIRCLSVFRAFVKGRADRPAFAAAAQEIALVANRHRGSNSIDGSAHAAVSATYAVANAMAGRALEAASYAAYATVYSYGGYAVNDPSAFDAEFAWQMAALQRLSSVVPAS